MAVAEFNDTNFDTEVLQANQPVLVDFWAPWCPPCRMLAPVIEELANENRATAKVGKLNIDTGTNTAQQFGVAEIPTTIVFKNGQVVEKLIGLQPKPRLQKAIDAAAT